MWEITSDHGGVGRSLFNGSWEISMGDEGSFDGAFNIPVVGCEILMAVFERFDLGDFLHEREQCRPNLDGAIIYLKTRNGISLFIGEIVGFHEGWCCKNDVCRLLPASAILSK
jgi:hypothetical protein